MPKRPVTRHTAEFVPTFAAICLGWSPSARTAAANDALWQGLVVETGGVFAQYILDELDGGQELNAVREMANGLAFFRTRWRFDHYGRWKVTGVVTHNVLRARIECGVPQVFIVPVAQRRWRGIGRAA